MGRFMIQKANSLNKHSISRCRQRYGINAKVIIDSLLVRLKKYRNKKNRKIKLIRELKSNRKLFISYYKNYNIKFITNNECDHIITFLPLGGE